jgi:hypothetical protein
LLPLDLDELEKVLRPYQETDQELLSILMPHLRNKGRARAKGNPLLMSVFHEARKVNPIKMLDNLNNNPKPVCHSQS